MARLDAEIRPAGGKIGAGWVAFELGARTSLFASRRWPAVLRNQSNLPVVLTMRDYASMHTTLQSEPVLISREAAAAMLSISTRSIDYLVSQGKLPARKLGRRTLIPRDAVSQLALNGDVPRIAQQKGAAH